MLRSLTFYITLLAATALLSPVAIASAFIVRNGDFAHWIARLWARTLLWVSGVRVEVSGLENIEPDQAYVFAANHQSQFDIFVLLASLPVQFRWLAKKELFRIPLLGRGMRSAGYIPIDRANRQAAFKSIDRAAARVREGTSVVIFPEGTRSQDGKLQPFKKGGFFLAMKSGRPIVPVSIAGTFAIQPKRTFLIRPRKVQVHVGRPVLTEQLLPQQRTWLIAEVRRRIRDHLPPEQQGEPEPEFNAASVAEMQ